ncbi:hypothetical protein [Aquitalea sp.]|uniref:hypothetical protein n=1 Tax=Aquitalea sp. TaxID=1872623 RepID=UPI0025872D67|nr:hypothetical protein [Aquitalea sp.]
MDLVNSLNNKLFDFSEVVDTNGLIRKMRTDLNVFSVDGFVFKLVSNFPVKIQFSIICLVASMSYVRSTSIAVGIVLIHFVVGCFFEFASSS